MAITFTNLGASANPDINSTTDATSYINSIWLPPTSGLIILAVYSRQTGGPPQPLVTGNSITWTPVASVTSAAVHRLTLYGANANGSTSGTTKIDFAGGTQLQCAASFFLAEGVDLSGGVAGAFVQASLATGSNIQTLSATLLAAGSADNRPIFAIYHAAGEATTPRTDWDELDDLSNPGYGLQTQARDDAFETTASATWASAVFAAAIAAEIKAASGAATYNDSVSLSKKNSISDAANANMSPSLILSERDSVVEGMTNNISPLILLSQKDGVSDGMNNNIPKDSSLNKVLTVSDAAVVGIYPALLLLQILSQTSSNFADMQGSVGLGGDFGINGSPNNNINPNASLLSRMGVDLSGGLNLLSNLTLAERMGFSILGNVSIYPSLSLGRDLAFVPANIALIGGSVSMGTALGLIDVPRLDAQASLALLKRLGINLSSSITTNDVEVLLEIAGRLGLGASAQLNSFPLVGLGERLFLLDANNANVFGTNVINEAKGINILGGLSIQDNVAIPIDLGLLTQKLVAKFGDVSLQERLGISDSVFANMQASVSLGETAGMGNTVNQILNAGLSINVVGSVLTISGLTVIIVKGFVFTSVSAKNSLSTNSYSSSALGSASAKNSVETGES